MKLIIRNQQQYSRGELLLRTFLGWFYIAIPHGVLLFFVGLGGIFLLFAAFWVILFTGRYPEDMFLYLERMMRWEARLTARIFNLSDGYPAFGLDAEDERVEFAVPYPERVSRGLTLVRVLFGWLFVLIPHGLVLGIRGIWVFILMFLAWWTVLFTGKYPAGWHSWVEGQLRWEMRVSVYLMFMTDRYPPFTGDRLQEEV
jgi:hypothetical protein